MKEVKSFRLASMYCDPQVASHENWSILSLYLFALVLMGVRF